MATWSSQGIMRSIAITGIWPWLWLAAVVICGKNGAGGLHTRIRPFSVRLTRGSCFNVAMRVPDWPVDRRTTFYVQN